MGYAYYKYHTNPPPYQETKNAINALAAAKGIEANKYAQKKLNGSQKAFDKAMNLWDLENKKFFISRNFDQVREGMLQAILLANEAWLEASNQKNSAKLSLGNQLKKIENSMTIFEEKYRVLPLKNQVFENYGKAKMLFIEASTYYRKKEFVEAENTAKDAEKTIDQIIKLSQQKLSEYFIDLPTWKANAEEARKLSKNGKIVILINKLESSCSIIKSGKAIATYKSEFGKNWMGDKKHMGDYATPEGIYKVTQLKKGSKTKYYKSLLINYPNDEDKKRFDQMIKNGEISKKSKIGGLIEIHGHGGKGVNWTEGCVALDNEDMDKIFDLVKVNTPVIIIGSEKTMSEYLK